jgi:hypothetical protein
VLDAHGTIGVWQRVEGVAVLDILLVEDNERFRPALAPDHGPYRESCREGWLAALWRG